MEHTCIMKTINQKIMMLAKSRKIFRASDISAQGLPRVALTRLVREGQLIRIDRGLYTLPEKQSSQHSSLAEVASRYPDGIICLLSALRVHDITTQSPFEVWLAIAHKARAPKLDYPQLRVIRFSDRARTEGIEEQSVDGITIKVTYIERTVVDCFKFRNKIGLDVALEALREAWDAKRLNMDELWRYANLFRVANVMRPYLESLS